MLYCKCSSQNLLRKEKGKMAIHQKTLEILKMSRCADISDALDSMGLQDKYSMVPEMRPLIPQTRFCGLARTMEFVKTDEPLPYMPYEDFERLHPENEAVSYAVYQQGMCHYSRMQGIDRDQTPTIQTIQTMARVLEMFPESRYAAMAQARIAEAQNNLAGHEFYVGEFYFRRKDYQAAMNRYLGLIQHYPDSGYHQRAMNRIAEYRQLVADGVIEEDANLRDVIYDSPFLSAPIGSGGFF
jgi:tetratricopeptide (TPR) repeat protein